MNFVKNTLSVWKQDNLLRKIVRNSGYLFIGNTLSTIVQSILSARLLGILGFGILGVVVEFSTNINRLLSFRMGELVVKYMGQYLAEDRSDRAAAVFKASILLETLSSILAYILLVLLAPLAAAFVVKDARAVSLIPFYALALLANFATESSTGFLQVTDRFRSQALINFIQSLLTAGLIVYAFVIHGDIRMVLGAYLAGKVFNGLTLAGYAFWRARQTLSPGWWRVSLKLLPPPREFWRFAWSTNFSGTVTMLTRDSESVWLSTLLSPLAAGYYKTAKAVINLVTLPITPFITAAYPAINRSVAERAWARLRDLLKKLTIISGAWTGAVALGLLILGRWLISTFYGPEFAPAYPALLILLIGFGCANVLYWNRNLLLSLNQPTYPLKVIAITGAVKLLLTFLLVPLYGYLMEAVLMSAFFVVSIGLIVSRGLQEVRKNVNLERNTGSDEPVPVLSPSPVTPIEKKAKRLRDKPRQESISRRTRVVNHRDWLVGLVFMAFAAVFFLGRLQGNYPLVILTGDGGNIASYAAALDHPDWFADDPALGDSGNIGVYATIHVPLLRLLYPMTGDYGLAYAILVFPQTFLQLLGFYILGRVLFKNRFWAFLLAFLTAMTVNNIGLGEIWGIWQEALPRVTFQSLLPFLLALSLVWKDRPRRWPWLMLFTGLLVYVHPISAPAWGLAIWLGLWLLHPKDWGWKKRLLVMFGLGLIFLAALTPFAVNYLSYRHVDLLLNTSAVMSILQEYSPTNLFNVPAAVGEFLWNMTRSLLLPLTLAGFVITWLAKKGDRSTLKIILLWMTGILITSILIPFSERIIEQQLHILPLETELLRCIRYFVPLLLLFWLWPLAEITPRLKTLRMRWIVFFLGIVMVGFWGATNRPAIGDMLDAISCFPKARLVCSSSRPIDDLIIALRDKTQPREGILFFNEDPAYTSQTLSVRYEALRPMVYTYRDSGILGYADRSALPAWLETTKVWESLWEMEDPQQRLVILVSLAENLGAEYLIIDFNVLPGMLDNLPVSVIMQNKGYLLLELHQ